MGKLGEYLHLNAENYLKYGTHRKGGHNNFSSGVLLSRQRFYQQIQSAKLNANLRQMEKEYNKKAYTQFQALKKMCQNPKYKQDFVKKIIEGASGISDAILDNPQLINLLTEAIEFDDIQQNITINLDRINTGKKFPKLTGEIYRRVDALLRRASVLITACKESNMTALQPLQKDLENLKKELEEYQDATKSLTNINMRLASLSKEYNEPLVQLTSKKSKFAINLDAGKLIARYLENAQQSIQIGLYETPLQASFAEWFAPFLGQVSQDIVSSSVVHSFIQNFQFLGSLPAQMMGNASIRLLNPDDLQRITNTTLTKTQMRFMGGKNFNGYFQASSVGKGNSQKIDGVLFFQGKGFNTSIKNVDLSKTYSQNYDASIIHLQGDIQKRKGTSLFYFLVGLDNFQNSLGTHVLNILSEHYEAQGFKNATIQNNIGRIAEQRRAAIDLLRIQILWSALTGQYQGKIMPVAQILEIHDKAADGSDRIKLYDMVDVFNKAYANNQFVISPDINLLSRELIKNPFIPGNIKKNPKIIQARITMALLDTRSRRFSVALKKTVLQR